MSVNDFDRCTPSDFAAIAKAWRQKRDNEFHDAWERTRMGCLCSLQPYSKKSLSVQDIMKFPWEEKGLSGLSGSSGLSGLSGQSEESKKRYEAEKKKWGIR